MNVKINVNNKRSMETLEFKHILIAYKSTNIGLQQAHDEILRLFSVVGRSEQLPYNEEIANCPDCQALPGLCYMHDK